MDHLFIGIVTFFLPVDEAQYKKMKAQAVLVSALKQENLNYAASLIEDKMIFNTPVADTSAQLKFDK